MISNHFHNVILYIHAVCTAVDEIISFTLGRLTQPSYRSLWLRINIHQLKNDQTIKCFLRVFMNISTVIVMYKSIAVISF